MLDGFVVISVIFRFVCRQFLFVFVRVISWIVCYVPEKVIHEITEQAPTKRGTLALNWVTIVFPVPIMKVSIAIACLLVSELAISATGQPARTSKLFLRDNWKIQSTEKTVAKGDTISTKSFSPAGWYSAEVPSTVVGVLVENKIYPDPMFDQNLRQIPGCSYPVGANFSNLPMPTDSPFRSSWWYRTEFHLPAVDAGKYTSLHFDGINFRGNIWLNGKQIATVTTLRVLSEFTN